MTEYPESDEVLHALTKGLLGLFTAAQESEDPEVEDAYLEALTSLVQTNLNRSFRVCLALGNFFIRTLAKIHHGAKVQNIEISTGDEEELWSKCAEMFLQDLANDDFEGAHNDFHYLASQQDDDENSGLARFINSLVVLAYGLKRNDHPLDF